MITHVALLRGINVGGKNLIRMSTLTACFEANGFQEVSTYIQSGNVIFASPRSGSVELARRIEAMLSATFNYQQTVVVRSRNQMRAVVENAPDGFGTQPASYRYDVIFLKEPLTAKTAMGGIDVKPGVDEAHPGSGVLYFSRLISKASQSRLTKIVSSPIYPSITIRNWNTTTQLLRLMG